MYLGELNQNSLGPIILVRRLLRHIHGPR